MSEVKPGQVWSSYAGAEKVGRHFFEIVSVDESRLSAAVRYVGPRKRGGVKSLTTLRMGLRGSRLEQDSDGTPPVLEKPRGTTVARASHYATLAQRSTASDYRRLIPPKWMRPAEKRRWLESGGKDEMS